jgi:hypothetical protein
MMRALKAVEHNLEINCSYEKLSPQVSCGEKFGLAPLSICRDDGREMMGL